MEPIGEEQAFVYVEGRKLRRGYTTGTSAAAAAGAAARLLLTGAAPPYMRILTPKGIDVAVEVVSAEATQDCARASVRKDGGDDADDTNGAEICAEVSRIPEGFEVDGGRGVGRVTRRGLDQPEGNAAINHVPRQMIADALRDAAAAAGYGGGLKAVITVPEGEAIARKTFNPRLGIVGGISILGTSGIVEPMSETALLGSIKAEMKVFMAQGRKYLLTVPGNYGKDFAKAYPGLEGDTPVECSNFIGDFLDMAVEMGAEGVLLVGNLGKLVKVAGGIMNTHSRNADARMEILASNAVMAGADAETAKRIMGCISTDDALEVLAEKGLIGPTMDILIPKIEFHMQHRVRGSIATAAVVFSTEFGILGETPSAKALLAKVEAKE